MDILVLIAALGGGADAHEIIMVMAPAGASPAEVRAHARLGQTFPLR